MIEQFSGESPEAIRQDVHAKTFTANLAKAMTYPQEQETPANIHKAYVPNLTYAIASLRIASSAGYSRKSTGTKCLLSSI